MQSFEWILISLILLLSSGIFLLFIKVASLKKQSVIHQSQLQAWELLINDLQFNLTQNEQRYTELNEKLADAEVDNLQVSKQLEHRIKNLQENLQRQEQVLGQINEQGSQDKFYTRAYKLAGLGADIEEIMKECELPRAEVEMLLAVYRQKSN